LEEHIGVLLLNALSLLLLLLLLQVWCDGDGSIHGGGAQAQAGSSWQQKHILGASCSSKAGSRGVSWHAACALAHICWHGCTAEFGLAVLRCPAGASAVCGEQCCIPAQGAHLEMLASWGVWLLSIG
jgi:hypothetical protein